MKRDSQKTKRQLMPEIPLLAILLVLVTSQLSAAGAPRLVLQITVDGLRGDRQEPREGPLMYLPGNYLC